MICNNCQKEINDNANFCPNCGYSFKSTNNKFSIIKYSIIVAVILFLSIILTTIPKTPEYAIYRACISIKNNDYEQAIKYVNIDKIVNNRINVIKAQMYSSQELQNNPFAGIAYMFVDALTSKLQEAIEIGFKEIVESKDNVFTDISKAKLAYFLIVKSYKDMSLKKDKTDKNEVTFIFSNNNEYNDLNLILKNSSKKHWEIVDISGYDFWKEYLGE